MAHMFILSNLLQSYSNSPPGYGALTPFTVYLAGSLTPFLIGTALWVTAAPTAGRADAPSGQTAPAVTQEAPFSPVWRLMAPEEKRHFIAGYLRGWGDALTVTEVVLSYIREKPAEAESGLEKILTLYRIGDLTAEPMVCELDSFFSKPENSQATLAQGVSSARRKLRAPNP